MGGRDAKYTTKNVCFVFINSNRPELVWDKNGIEVTSSPPGDENGVIELSVESGVRGYITLTVKNTGTEKIRLNDITLLWSVNFFDYSEISRIGPERGNLSPGNTFFLFILHFGCVSVLFCEL